MDDEDLISAPDEESEDGIVHTLTVAASQAGLRLDRWLAESLPARACRP
jgi:hypothetical protein